MSLSNLELAVIAATFAIPASGVVPAAFETIRNANLLHKQRIKEYEDPYVFCYDYEDAGRPSYAGSLYLSAKATLSNYSKFFPGPFLLDK